MASQLVSKASARVTAGCQFDSDPIRLRRRAWVRAIRILAMLLAAPVPVIMAAYTEDIVTLRALVLASCLLFVAATMMTFTDEPPPPGGGFYL